MIIICLGITMDDKIILGLPKGSLNNVKRGNTHQLFVDAGYEVKVKIGLRKNLF